MFIAPHKKASREVTEKDLTEIFITMNLAQAFFSKPNICFAFAHSQINDRDPLRFFITREGKVIINPEIVRHSAYLRDSKEGCMSFPGRPQIVKLRYQKVEVSFQTIHEGKLTGRMTANLSGLESRIAQHEIDHMDGKYCYEN